MRRKGTLVRGLETNSEMKWRSKKWRVGIPRGVWKDSPRLEKSRGWGLTEGREGKCKVQGEKTEKLIEASRRKGKDEEKEGKGRQKRRDGLAYRSTLSCSPSWETQEGNSMILIPHLSVEEASRFFVSKGKAGTSKGGGVSFLVFVVGSHIENSWEISRELISVNLSKGPSIFVHEKGEKEKLWEETQETLGFPSFIAPSTLKIELERGRKLWRSSPTNLQDTGSNRRDVNCWVNGLPSLFQSQGNCLIFTPKLLIWKRWGKWDNFGWIRGMDDKTESQRMNRRADVRESFSGQTKEGGGFETANTSCSVLWLKKRKEGKE